MDMNLDHSIFPDVEYMDEQQQAMFQHGWMYNPGYTEYPAQHQSLWHTSSPAYLPSTQQQQRFSTSTSSSIASNFRASVDDSVFSHRQTRSSLASIASSYSQSSIGLLADLQQPFQRSQDPTFAEVPTSPVPLTSRRRPAQRQASPEKNAFATCVSRTRRSRRTQRTPRYWCTSCEEPFIEKYDWKRHEETYQERPFVFRCSLCSAVYFLEKDFLHHHETRHNCETCHRDEHLEAAKQQRRTRTGWGCGFCTHFSTNWRERCNHIAQHFEKDGKTMEDWSQSHVILSLLQRKAIKEAWCRIFQLQPQLRANLGWSQHNTGRVEGYPENNAEPHLQDLLEYYQPSDDAAKLAELAFFMIDFPSLPPEVPRKDYKDNRTATIPSLMTHESWDKMIYTIKNDETLPSGVCTLDHGILNDALSNHTAMQF